MSLIVLLLAVAEAGCESPATVSEIRKTLATLETAFVAGQTSVVVSSGMTLDDRLPCVVEPLPADVAAALHRAQGLRANTAGQSGRAEMAFAASRITMSSSQLPSAIPADAVVRHQFQARAARATTTTLPAPQDAWLHIDGTPTRRKPIDLPAVVQLAEDTEAGPRATATAYLWPGDAMLAYTPAPESAPTVVASTSDAPEAPPPMITFDRSETADLPGAGSRSRVGVGTILAISAGATAAAAAGTFGGSVISHGAWQDAATPFEDLAGLRSRTNTLAVASGGLAAVATGLGVGAVVAGTF